MVSCQAPPKQVPRTIDNTRVADDTIVEPEDHEVRWTLSFSVLSCLNVIISQHCDYFWSNCRITGHSKPGPKKWFFVVTAVHQFLGALGTEVCLKSKAFTLLLWGYAATGYSKIQLVVYYQCCILIGWGTIRLLCYSPLYIASSEKCGPFGGKKGLKSSFN